MSYTYVGQYFALLDNSTEFICSWCGCNEFHLRGKLIINLCCGCETLHITNRDICNDLLREQREKELEERKTKYKNITVTLLENEGTLSVNLSPDKLKDDVPTETKVFSQYQKAQQLKDKIKTINPIKLKH